MKNLFIGLMAFMMFATNAFATIHLEPYLGYAKGEEDSNATNPDDYSGMGFGARVGFKYMGLIVGGTYDSQSIEAESTGSGATTTSDWTGTNMGAFLGYEFPIGVRVWGSYYFSADFELDNTSLAGAEYSGSGYSVGAGFSVIPMVLSLNLEMKKFTYDELQLSGQTSTVNDVGSSYFFASISAPLSF